MVTTYGKNLILDHVFHTANERTLPSTYYIALSTTTPTIAGKNFTEQAANTGYTRIPLKSLMSSANGVTQNASMLTYAKSLTDWGLVTYWGIFDAAAPSTGNLIIYEQLLRSRNVESATIFAFPAGELSFSLVD